MVFHYSQEYSIFFHGEKKKPQPPKREYWEEEFNFYFRHFLNLEKMPVKDKLNQNSKNPLRNLDLFSLLKTLKVLLFSGNIFIKLSNLVRKLWVSWIYIL